VTALGRRAGNAAVRVDATLATTVAAIVIAAVIAATAAGCGATTGRILERIDAGTPPTSNLRVDVFLLRAVATCAVGSACAAADPTSCFYVTDGSGARTSFSSDGLRFVPPADPLAQGGGGNQVSCFRLVLDDATLAAAKDLMGVLRAQVFQASGGDVNLDLRLHEIPSIDAGFMLFLTGLFLQPASLAAVGLPLINRETDFTFAITGDRDPATGTAPKLDQCEGSNWPAKGVLGASTYSWLAMSSRCARSDTVLRTWLNQVALSRRDITVVSDLYGGNYPACGRGAADPTAWFPQVDDCTTDPDAPTCGRATCPDQAAFYMHILSSHWSRGKAFDGNYCDDGRMDFDETGVDRGGVCDLIGR
jgi:hypothetical protein